MCNPDPFFHNRNKVFDYHLHSRDIKLLEVAIKGVRMILTGACCFPG
jgi:hypothetical protein